MDKVEYKKITFEFMTDYILKNASNDKHWFKSVAIDENGNYNHLVAKKAFCERYMPNVIPKAKPRVKKSDILKDW